MMRIFTGKPENQLVFNGRFMNSRNILMEIKRIIGSNQFTDAYTQITLSADKVIDTRLKWRPEVFADAKVRAHYVIIHE